MRIASIASLLLSLAVVAACGGTSKDRFEELDFAEPNKLVGQEIEERIDQIPFQHREELFNNLLWLAQQGEQSIRALVEGLDSSEPKTRANCCWVLGQIGDRRTIQFLQPMTRDDNQAVRLEAARALVSMGDLSAAPQLIEGLDSDKIEVRHGCHEVLKRTTRRDFGYDHLEENPSMRQMAVLRWRQWWADQSNDPWFAKEYAQEHGLETEDAPETQGTEGTELQQGDWGTPAAPGGETTDGETTGGETTGDEIPETIKDKWR